MSLSFTVALMCNSELELVMLPNSVPPSLIFISPPSASRIISPATSTVKSPLALAMSPVTVTPLEVVSNFLTSLCLSSADPSSLKIAIVSPLTPCT